MVAVLRNYTTNYTDDDIAFALYTDFVTGWGFFNSSNPSQVYNQH